MEQLGFRPDQQQAYQGAKGEWQQFFEAWSRCRIGLLRGLAANDPQGKAITSGIKTGVVASDADDMRRPYVQQSRMVGYFVILVAALVSPIFSNIAMADEGGVSFWLPGDFGSYAAVPSQPGWLFESTYYHASAAASGGISFPRGGGIEAGVKSPTDYFLFTPTYTFETQIFGAQPAFGMTVLFGRNSTEVSKTLTGPGGATLSGSQSEEIFGFSDPSPTASLKWSRDVHNFMVYATAGIPVGAYESNRLAALGLGHWAVDGGVGYTYLDEKAGIEASAVFGLTYNFINPYTQYQSGIDAHLDWAISPYLNDKFHIGAVGYFYNQISGDSGAGAQLGDFKSSVAGVGPQIGFFFPIFGRQGYLNLRAYYEFDARNRLEGWNAQKADRALMHVKLLGSPDDGIRHRHRPFLQ